MKVIIALVVAGVAVALVLGFTGQSQAVAQRQFCQSLDSLNSSLQQLTGLDPTSASEGEFQSDASAVRNAWTDVKEDAASLSNANLNSLDDAWDEFANSLNGLGQASSVSDAEQAISSSADGLEAAVSSSLKSYDCTS